MLHVVGAAGKVDSNRVRMDNCVNGRFAQLSILVRKDRMNDRSILNIRWVAYGKSRQINEHKTSIKEDKTLL